MDMGFTREHCTAALLHTTNLEQATDYILTHPPPPVEVTVSYHQRLALNHVLVWYFEY